MFLLCAGFPNELDCRPPHLLEQRYRSHAVSVGAIQLAWLEDGYTSCSQDESEVRISLADPNGGTTAVVIWKIGSSRFVVTRPWPGYHSIYIREGRSLVVASHLKMLDGLMLQSSPLPKQLPAGVTRVIDSGKTGYVGTDIREPLFNRRAPHSLTDAARSARLVLVKAMRAAPEDAALLLSGGIDSSALAVAARLAGRSPQTFTFGTILAQRNDISKSDMIAARRVARHLSLPHEEIIVDQKQIVENAVPAVFASELHRGTFVDDAVVYLEVAKTLSMSGVRTVLVGEAGDDCFGCFPSMLRFYRGHALQSKLRRELLVGSPNDYAAIQKIFSFFGIRIIDPFLSLAVARLGYCLPLDMRIDQQRLMKPVLRRAFASDLPPEIVSREKHVSRDVSGVRETMVESLGSGRNRYLKTFKDLFRNGGSAAHQALALAALNA